MSQLENKINNLQSRFSGIDDLKKRKKIEKELITSGELFSILREVKQIIQEKKVQEIKFKNLFSSLSITNYKESLSTLNQNVLKEYKFEIICYLILLELNEGRLNQEERNTLAIHMIEYCKTIEKEIHWNDNTFPLVLFFLWPKWDAFKIQLFTLNKNQINLIQNYRNYVDRENKTIRDYFAIEYLSNENILAFHLTELYEKISETKKLVSESDLAFQTLNTHYLQLAKNLKYTSQISDWLDFLSLGYDSVLLEFFTSLKDKSNALYFAKNFLEKASSDTYRIVSYDLLKEIESILETELDPYEGLGNNILLTELITRYNKNSHSEQSTEINNFSEFRRDISKLKTMADRDDVREKLIDSLILSSAYEQCLQVVLEIEDDLPPISKVLTLIHTIIKEKDYIHIFNKIEFNDFLDKLRDKVNAIKHEFYAPKYKIDFLYVQSYFLKNKKQWDSHFKSYPSGKLEEKIKHQINALPYVIQENNELILILKEILKERSTAELNFYSFQSSSKEEILNPLFSILVERNLILNENIFLILEQFCNALNPSFSVYFACRFSKLYLDRGREDLTKILLTLAKDKINMNQRIEEKMDSLLYLMQSIKSYSMESFQVELLDLGLKIVDTIRDYEMKKLDEWVLQSNKLGLTTLTQSLLETKLKIHFMKTLHVNPVMIWEQILEHIDRADSPGSKKKFLEVSFSFYKHWEYDSGEDFTKRMASITVELFKINPKLGKTYLNRTLAHMGENDFQYSETLEIIGKIIYDNQLIQDYISLLDNFCTDELALETMISVSLVLGEALIQAGMIVEAFEYLKEEKIKEYNSEFNYSYHEKEWYEGKRFHLFDMMGKNEEGINFVKSIEYDYSDEQLKESIDVYQKWMEIEAKKMEQSSSSLISLVDLPKDLMDLKNSLNENSIHLENVLQNCLTSIALSGYAKECRKFIEEEWKM